jgi:hypothetical protein
VVTHLIIQLNLCQRSRENPIYGGTVGAATDFLNMPNPQSVHPSL